MGAKKYLLEDHSSNRSPATLKRRINPHLPLRGPIGGAEQRGGDHENGEHYDGV
jgi:hypothetical protein